MADLLLPIIDIFNSFAYTSKENVYPSFLALPWLTTRGIFR